MTSLIHRKTVLLLFLVVVAAVGAVSVIRAQSQTDPGSLVALTAEVHQLRLSVEDATRAQTQTQALAVYLSVQKDRVQQVAARLDGVRKDLDAANEESRSYSEQIKQFEAQVPTSTPEIRSQLGWMIQDLKQRLGVSSGRLQALQSREADMAQLLQTEEARWTDTVSRLEQIIRR